jgi:stress response protein YsnF
MIDLLSQFDPKTARTILAEAALTTSPNPDIERDGNVISLRQLKHSEEVASFLASLRQHLGLALDDYSNNAKSRIDLYLADALSNAILSDVDADVVVDRIRQKATIRDLLPLEGAWKKKRTTSYNRNLDTVSPYEILVAVYDTASHAEAAVKALKAAGFADSDISMFDSSRLKAGRTSLSPGVREAGLWHRLFGTDVYEHEANIYGQTVEDGGVVISVRVLEREVAHASAVLNIHRPVDVHDRAVTSGIAPAAHVEAVERKLAALPLADEQHVAVSPKLAAAQPDVLRLAEEHLEVGKEMHETGRTRVRRFVTERAVAEDATLHEEHAEVLRKAVFDTTYVDEIDWADGMIEIIETAEHALVNKTARVVEEVGLKKIGSDHVETIKDKLRRQQVEIERLGADGKVIRDPRTA